MCNMSAARADAVGLARLGEASYAACPVGEGEKMNNPLANAVLTAWRRNNAYGLRLVEDLSDAQFVAQPIQGRVINHPAWIVSHLNLYTGIAVALLHGEPFADPIDHPHGMKSEPSNDLRVYGP